jgi:3-oxoacyl-(acyl-carrier-protein) synthase
MLRSYTDTEQRPFSISAAQLTDLDEICELEYLCWNLSADLMELESMSAKSSARLGYISCSVDAERSSSCEEKSLQRAESLPGSLDKAKADKASFLNRVCNFKIDKEVIRQRLETNSRYQFVAHDLESNRIVGCIYTQQIEDLALILDDESINFSNHHKLHSSNGSILQLVGVFVHPDFASMQIGAALRDFALLSTRFHPFIEDVVAFTRCSNCIHVAEDEYASYVFQSDDPTLQFHVSGGAEIVSIRKNYRLEDTLNYGNAVLIRYPSNSKYLVISSELRRESATRLPNDDSNLDDLLPNHSNSDVLDFVENTIHSLISSSSQYDIEQLLDEPFMYIGFDSLSLMDFQHRIEKFVHPIGVDSLILFQHPTPRKLINYLESVIKRRSSPTIIDASDSAKSMDITSRSESQLLHSQQRDHNDRILSDLSANRDEFAICAMACRFPDQNRVPFDEASVTPKKYFDHLLEGVDVSADLPLSWCSTCGTNDESIAGTSEKSSVRAAFLHPMVAEYFDPNFYGISMTEAKDMDPHQRILLDIAYEILVQANILRPSSTGRCATVAEEFSSIGVFVGLSNNEWIATRDESSASAFSSVNLANSSAANRISYVFGLTGPSMVVDAACSSSFAALHAAQNSLKCNDCDFALVLSADLLVSSTCISRRKTANMLAPDGKTKAFDESADGYMRGEGAGGILLKRLSDLQDEKCLAVLSSCVINHNGRNISLTAPSTDAQAKLLRAALTKAKISPNAVKYIEAHGTGTKLGDPIEIQAISQVFSASEASEANSLVVGSVKTNIGHLEGAAGMASIIKAIMVMRSNVIPATLHLKNVNPLLFLRGEHDQRRRPITFPSEPLQFSSNADDMKAIGINCFGSGGTNLHAIIRSPSLSQYRDTAVFHQSVMKKVFMFPGQGKQMLKFFEHYYRNDDDFAESMLQCSNLLQEQGLTCPSLIEVIFPGICDIIDDCFERLASNVRSVYEQTAIIAIECSLLKMCEKKGIVPDAVVGHSIGK